MNALVRRLLIALAVMGGCALLAIFVIGAAIALLMVLAIGFVVGPLSVLAFGGGPLSRRVFFFRRNRDRVIDL